jgi:hypothetical protein
MRLVLHRRGVLILVRPCADLADKPIRMIVQIAAGSVTDVTVRAASKELETRFGQRLVTESRAAGILVLQPAALLDELGRFQLVGREPCDPCLGGRAGPVVQAQLGFGYLNTESRRVQP